MIIKRNIKPDGSACQLCSYWRISSRALTDRRVSDEQEFEIGRIRSFLCHYDEMINNGLIRRVGVLDSAVCLGVKRFGNRL